MIAADAHVKAATDDLFELSIDQQEFQKKEAFTGIELVHDTHRLALMNAMLQMAVRTLNKEKDEK